MWLIQLSWTKKQRNNWRTGGTVERLSQSGGNDFKIIDYGNANRPVY